MKKFISVMICISMLVFCSSCGQISSESTDDAASSAAESIVSSSSSNTESGSSSTSAVSNLNPTKDAVVIESQDCFDTAYLFRPTESGTYHFCAQTADSFVGDDVEYASNTISWTIYVLDEEFEDGWRFLSQAYHPAAASLSSSTDLPLTAGQYVYCVCDLNGFTSSPAADGAGALSITLTDEAYGPSSSNNYQLDISIGAESHLDLNGDGIEDIIYYSVSQEISSDDYYQAANPESLSINGVDYLSSDSENPLSEYGIWLENPGGTGEYYLVDLDTSDDWCELAISDAGSNDYRTTYYFRYDGTNLSYLGYMTGFPDDQTTTYHGDGSVTAMSRLDLLQTWYGARTFQLQDGSLQLVNNEFFAPIQPEGRKVSLLQELTAYTEPDLSSETLLLSPSTALTFLSTDGTHWLEIQCADGTTGWAYFSDFSTVQSGDAELDTESVFGNLTLAG